MGPQFYGHPLSIRLLDAAAVLTTPLLPDDYLGQLNPLWSTREPRGRVEAVVAETRDCVTLWLRPGRGWPDHVPGQYVRVGVDVDGVRHWRTYSLTSVPRRRDGRIAITVKRIPGGSGVRAPRPPRAPRACWFGSRRRPASSCSRTPSSSRCCS